jgi:predicted TIM-barrel fold metal-dependent hydrolase
MNSLKLFFHLFIGMETTNAIKKIDIHCHATKRRLEHTITKVCDLDFIQSKMTENNIDKTVVLATYFPHKASGISNYRMHHWINQKNSLIDEKIGRNKKKPFEMFASLDFENYFYQGINELEEMADEGLIIGIKIYTCYQEIDLNSDRFDKVLQIAESYNLPIMFHLGDSYSSMRKYGRPTIATPVYPKDLETVVQKKEINFIVSHLALPNVRDLTKLVNSNSNVYSDMSGLIGSFTKRHKIPYAVNLIKLFLDECGPERLLFGTDFPVQTHEDSVLMLDEALLEYSIDDKKNVYHNNAKKLLYGRNKK